jgi:hypothetical protein
VLEEVVGLVGARATVGVGKVVATADEACIGGTCIVIREARVDVSRALGSLYWVSERFLNRFSKEYQP